MIRYLKVVNLNGNLTFETEFHEDINIITGKNGSGKTTVLKLLWYAISGNFIYMIREIDFDSFELETSEIKIHIHTENRHEEKMLSVTWESQEKTPRTEISSHRFRVGLQSEGAADKLRHMGRTTAFITASSIFYPTFRRIEGGFSTDPQRKMNELNDLNTNKPPLPPAPPRLTTDLKTAFNQLSDRLGKADHHFVASISTDDIVRLLNFKYTEISEKTNYMHMDLSRFILGRIGNTNSNRTDTAELDASRELLRDIRHRVETVTKNSEEMLQPFTFLSRLISKVFQDKGIKITDPVSLGEARVAIESGALSSGEKHMLSFLCYNAFAKNSCIFIDEPEISLHVDWQRILFPMLMEQSTGNQFIVATHSPFIYSKYPDKELILNPDRGDQDADA